MVGSSGDAVIDRDAVGKATIGLAREEPADLSCDPVTVKHRAVGKA